MVYARCAMPLDQHPFIARLSAFMTVSATDLSSLDKIIGNERSIERRKDLVVDGFEYRNVCFVKDGYAMR